MTNLYCCQKCMGFLRCVNPLCACHAVSDQGESSAEITPDITEKADMESNFIMCIHCGEDFDFHEKGESGNCVFTPPNKDAPSSNSWEEEFDKCFWDMFTPDNGNEPYLVRVCDQRYVEKAKAIASKQISEAEKRGMYNERRRIRESLNPGGLKGNHSSAKASSDMPEKWEVPIDLKIKYMDGDEAISDDQREESVAELEEEPCICLYPHTHPRLSEEPKDWEKAFERTSKEFDYMVKPEHSERFWYVILSLFSQYAYTENPAISDERSEESLAKSKDWEKEFGELVRDITSAGWMAKSEARTRLDGIIRKAISEAESRMIGKLLSSIQKMKKEAPEGYGIFNDGYNHALDQVIQLIQKGNL